MMVALSGAWQPRLGHLADFQAMDQATVTATVKTLVRRGLMILQADDRDARVRRPVLSKAGQGLVARAVPLSRAEHSRVQAELTTDAVKLTENLAQLR